MKMKIRKEKKKKSIIFNSDSIYEKLFIIIQVLNFPL